MSTRILKKSAATITFVLAALFVGVLGARAATYTWIDKTTGDQPWTDATNWDANGQFGSGSANELRFFADLTQFATNGTQTITSVPTTLSMNTLTLNGYAQNNVNGFTILFDPASTWTIGDGTTSTINLNTKKHSFDTHSVFYKLPDLVLNAGTTTITGGGNNAGFHFTGSISGANAGYGILKSGTSRIDFQASNTYTGTTEVTGGILRLSHTHALPGSIGATGGTSALTLNGGVIELAAGDFQRNLGTGSDQFQITGGASGFSAVGADRVVSVNNDPSQEIVWGSTTFNPTTLELNSLRAYNGINPNPAITDTTDHDLTLSNKIDLNGTTRNIQVDSKTAFLPGIIRNSSGTAGINKSGNGTLLLAAANTYNGDTTVSAGTVSIENSGNAGGGGAIVFNGGTLQIRGTNLTSLTQLSGLGHAVSFNSGKTAGFDIQDAGNTFTADQVLNQGSGGLIKSGAGTLVLNKDNTFTGATTLSGGGTLVLDYTDTSHNGSKLWDTAALTLTGSTIDLKGGSHDEVVNNMVMSLYYANSITRTSGTAVIHLNAITGNNNRNALSFSEGGIATTDLPNNATTGILGGWATVGSHLAINSTNGADGLITAYSGYTDFVSSASGATTNYQLQGSGAVSATQPMNTLRIENTADDQVLNLGTYILTLANFNGGNGGGVLLYAGGANNNYTITGTSSAAALSSTNTNGQSLGINVYQGTLTLDVRIANTGSNFVKTGAGTLIMNKATSTAGSGHTGAAYLLQGATRMADAGALGTGTVTVNAGAALELSNDISVGAKALSLNGAGVSNNGALRNYSDNNTYGGPITIGASGARINADAATSLTLTGGVVTALTQDVTFGGAGDTTVATTGVSGGGSLIKNGAGILTLSAPNTYTGGTTVTAGTLLIDNTTGSGTGSGLVTVNTGGTLGGTGTIGGAVVVNGGGTVSPGASVGTLAAGNTTWNDGGSLRFDIDDATGTAGAVGGSGWDLLDIAGTLDLTALTTGGFTVVVDTLLPGGGTNPGQMVNFDPDLGHSWEFARTSGGVTGFDAGMFLLDVTGFANSYDGTFKVTADGHSLYITFSPSMDITDSGVSTVVASPTSVPADGISVSTITVTVKSTDGTGLAGKDVALAITSGPGMAVIAPAGPVTTDANGVATFTVTSNIAGTEVFTATDITDGGSIAIAQTASVEFTTTTPPPPATTSQTSLIAGYTPPAPPPPDAPQTSLAVTTTAPTAPVPDSQTTAQYPAEATEPVEDAVPGVIRVTEYYLTTGDFGGTTTTLPLNQELAPDYFILVRGSRTGDGLSMPDSDYARVAAVPGGRGGLADSGAADRIGLRRAAAEFDWEGVVTVVECLDPDSPAGFRLVDAVVATLAGTSGSLTCAPWVDASRVVPFGGNRGGGVELTGGAANRYQGTSAYARLAPGGGNGTLDWQREAGGETLVDATMTTFVVEWGSGWTVQHAAVAGSAGGDGVDAPEAYTTAAIAPVARANTWVWGTGIRSDAGTGDCAESCLVTLGDGVNQNATESAVAVGSEYTDVYSFDLYAMTHPALAVNHRFKPDGDLNGLDIPVGVAPAAPGARFAWLYNGCNGTSSRFPRPRMWSRYTAADTVTISRGYDGAEFPAWIQGIDFSGLND